MKKGDYSLKGFTIIEVSLVLAIAGLIFLMIFIALPALQRQQRDTARKEDITALISAVKKYQTNNRGSLPEKNGIFKISEAGSESKTTWGGFIRDYMDKEDFMDPYGEEYLINVSSCDQGTSGDQCKGAENIVESSFPNDYTIYIIKQAKCAGDEELGAVSTSNPRKIAVLYRLEGGWLYCADS